MGRLKAVDLRRAKPGLYSDGDGLYLQVRPGKRGPIRSWILRYVENGRQHDMGLGPVRFISLAEARKATWDAQRLRLQGIDPLQHRRAQSAPSDAHHVRSVCSRLFRSQLGSVAQCEAPPHMAPAAARVAFRRNTCTRWTWPP